MKQSNRQMLMIGAGFAGIAFLLYNIGQKVQQGAGAAGNMQAQAGAALDNANAAASSVQAAADQAATMLSSLQQAVPFNLLGNPSADAGATGTW